MRKILPSLLLLLLASFIMGSDTGEMNANNNDEVYAAYKSMVASHLDVLLEKVELREREQQIIESDKSDDKKIHMAQMENKKEVVVKEKEKVKEKWFLYEVTFYTNGKESTGKSKGHKDYGRTASGKITKEGRTVSADINVLPMGTVIYIEGFGERTVEDTGSAIKGNKLDLFVEDLAHARELGRKKGVKVKIVKMGEKK